MMDPGEQALVEAAKHDPAQFAPLYESHFERVYSFIARRVRDRTAAEDLTSEVFRQALAGIGAFEWRGIPFAAWLYRIAANEIADYVKKRVREENVVAKGEPDPGEVEAVERRATLFRLVADLAPDQRRVITMRFGQERSIREVAAELGRSEGAVKQLQWRALQALRARMEQSHG